MCAMICANSIQKQKSNRIFFHIFFYYWGRKKHKRKYKTLRAIDEISNKCFESLVLTGSNLTFSLSQAIS